MQLDDLSPLRTQKGVPSPSLNSQSNHPESPTNSTVLPSTVIADTVAETSPNSATIVQALFLFLIAFALTAALLRLVLPPPIELYGALRSEKLAILERNHYEYPTASFGSSRMNQGFDPRVFDAALSGSPLAVHSFNLGVDGGTQSEQRIMAIDFLQHLRPPSTGPCLVLLEANAPPIFAPYLTAHPRQFNILDWYSRNLEYSFTVIPLPRLHHFHLVALSFESAFFHSINLGMLSNYFFRPPYDETNIQDQTVDDRRGLHLRVADPPEKADFDRVYAGRPATPERVADQLEAGHDILINDLHQSPNGNRVQFVWVVMPLINDLYSYSVFPESQKTSFGDVPIINLARPDLYPQLYRPELWTNNQHLTEEGAKIASQLLASLLLKWSQNHPMQLHCGG